MPRMFIQDQMLPANVDDAEFGRGMRHPPSEFDGAGASVIELTVGLFKFRRRILACMGLIVLLAIAAALLIRNDYVAKSAVLVTMSQDYGVRPDAGSQSANNGSLDQKQIIRTERDILGNDQLHREVLREIGPTVIYPQLAERPDGPARVVAAIKGLPAMLARLTSGQAAPAARTVDPVERALPLFDASFSTQASPDSTAITLSFSDPNPAMAARVLNVLMQTYLRMRRTLYTSPQSLIVQQRVDKLRAGVAAANANLNAYKASHNIGDFRQRELVLENYRGAAEAKLSEVTGLVAQNKARIATLTAQLEKIPRTVLGHRNMSADVHADPEHKSVNALRQSLATLESTYRPNSPVVQRLRKQLQASERDFRQVTHDGTASSEQFDENPLWTKANLDLLVATSDLSAAVAYRQKLVDYLAKIEAQLHGTTLLDADLTQLEQQRQVATDAYSAGMKEFEARKLIDLVDAQKQTSVRILEPAAVPIRASGMRRLVVLAGVVLALVVGGLVGLLSNYFRPYYLTSDEIERELGLPVLASIGAHGPGQLPVPIGQRA